MAPRKTANATRASPRRRSKQVVTLSADDVDPKVPVAGTAIRGVEYSDDDRTAGANSRRLKVDRLDPVELEMTYRRSGLVFKGVNAKARDAFKAGFEIVPDDENPTTRKALNLRARDWMRVTKFRARAQQAIREGYWAGDGYLELIYPGAPIDAPPAGVAPSRVVTITPFHMRAVLEYRPGKQRGEVIYYLYGPQVREVPLEQIQRWVEGGELPQGVESVLHPARVAHFQPYPIAGDPDGYGMSVIEAAIINVISKTVGDRSMGDIMAWAAQGFFVLNVEFATEEELKRAKAYLEAAMKARKTYFVGSERSKFESFDPVIPNVDSFYKQFYIEIAAALEMPTMILMGVQKGTVSGSSVDILQYYDDVKAFQEDHVEPEFFPLIARVLARTDFSIRWRPLHVDKQTVADTTFKIGQTATGLVGAQILTRRQAVAFLRRALPDADLPDPDDVPDEYVEEPRPSMVGAAADNAGPSSKGGDPDE